MSVQKEKANVFVIGGGPAGLAAAIAARRKGFSVTVADGAEPPIDKACGEGMMPGTKTALRELGVELPVGTGYPFRGIRFVQGRVHAEADLPDGWGIGIRRTLLHGVLIQEAENCGVKLLWKTPVSGISCDAVRLPTGLVPAKWIVGADGHRSRVRQWSGLNNAVLSSHRVATRRHYRVKPWAEHVEIYWGARVQAYVTPISGEEVCIVAMSESVEDAEFERALKVMPELRERLEGAELCSRERGAITEMRSLKGVWRGNVALVGDASGGVDAITGEGLRLAFRQACALAEAMDSGDLRHYELAHRQLGRRPVWMGKLMLQLGRSEKVRRRMLQMLSRNPELFARLLAVHSGHATKGEVVIAGTQLGWQFLAA